MTIFSRHSQSLTFGRKSPVRSWWVPLISGLLTCLSPAADVTHTNGVIGFAGSGFALRFSDTNGALLSVTSSGQTGPILASGELGLWSASFKEGGGVNATTFKAGSPDSSFSWAASADGTALLLSYSNNQIAVEIRVTEISNGVDFAAQATPSQNTILEFGLPARLRFRPEALQRLICPMNSNESVGASFQPGFFTSQPESSPAGWDAVVKGPSGYISLYGGALISRPDNDPPVPITMTTNGRLWLGDNVATRWDATNAVVNRPSTRSQVDLVLADSVNGPFFAGSHLGGKGYLFRLGGSIGQAQQPLALDLVLAAIEQIGRASCRERV